MIHFLIHVTSGPEIARLSYIKAKLAKFFPESRLHVFNQTNTMFDDCILVENTKSMGFGWTLRFLKHATSFVESADYLIKIDPDIEITGNPLEGVVIHDGECFGQMKQVQGVNVLLGGFQGYTKGALQKILEIGAAYENEIGPQDAVLYRVGCDAGMAFASLPWLDLWADRDNFDTNLKIVSWRRRCGQ